MSDQLALAPELPLDQIAPNPNNIRGDLGELDDLVSSIQTHGVLEPVVVFRSGDAYTLIMGHRRLAAAGLAGLETIPYVERPEPSRVELLEMMLAENNQREDLDPIEEALALVEIKAAGARTVKSIAAGVNRSQAWVAGRLAIVAKLPQAVWPMIKAGDLAIWDAVTIAQAKGLSSEDRLRVCKASPAHRDYELKQLQSKAVAAQRWADVEKAWPGRQITDVNPDHHPSKFDTRFGLARYGTAPGQVNTPAEMGDAEMQVVFVDQYRSAAAPEIWHRAPETLPADVFVEWPEDDQEANDRQVTLEMIPDDTATIEDLPGADKHAAWLVENWHTHCPGHRELLVPWDDLPLGVCVVPEVHADGVWADLKTAYDESDDKPVREPFRRQDWRENLGPDIAGPIEEKLREQICAIPSGVVSMLMDLGSYGNVDGEFILIDHLIDELGDRLANIVRYSNEQRIEDEDRLERRWLIETCAAAGVDPPEGLEDALVVPDVAGFMEAMEAALAAGGTVYGVDEEAVNELGNALMEAGWIVNSLDDGPYALEIIEGDGDDAAARRFVITTAGIGSSIAGEGVTSDGDSDEA